MKRFLLLFPLAAALQWLSAGPCPATSLPLSPDHTDTLTYSDYFRDPDQPIYILNGFDDYWVTVRFTPESVFTLTTVYFVVENIIGSNQPCFVYVALDSAGQPDPSHVLAGPIMIPGPLPHKQVITALLDSAVVVDSLQDFHVMISSSGEESYSAALELPGDYPERTGHSADSHSGPFQPYVFPTPADAIIGVGGYYGTEEPVDIDLETTCLTNGLDLFFPDAKAAEGLAISSDITNNGSDTAYAYSLSWMIRDENDHMFMLYDTLPPPLPPGGALHVECPLPWTPEIEGEYVIMDHVEAEFDNDTTNNSSELEQVANFHRNYALYYDDGEADDALLVPKGLSYAVRFSPWSRIASVDSVSLFFTEESECRISILDAFYPNDPPGGLLFATGDSLFDAGWSTIRFADPVSPIRSTFFVAVTGIQGSASLGMDTDPPLTSRTCLPGIFYASSDSMNSWQHVVTGDPLMKVYVTKRRHEEMQYVELLSCVVDRDSVLPGKRIEVKTYWEYYDATGDDPLDFAFVTGIVNYPSLVPLVLDTLDLANQAPGLHINWVGFVVPPLRPGAEMGMAGTFIASESEGAFFLWDFILGERFEVIRPHHILGDKRETSRK